LSEASPASQGGRRSKKPTRSESRKGAGKGKARLEAIAVWQSQIRVKGLRFRVKV
jgi:hypothetical protein